jgi:nitrite reductase/ring-hydroxylating ferredoxin subunit
MHGWKIVATSGEVGKAPFGVRRGEGDIVLFRDAEGRCHALLDRCAHRRAPLSIGQVTEAGLIECPYHGWRYDGATGICREIPNLSAGERVPKTYCVPAFPIIESGGFVLIWPKQDEAARAAPELPVAVSDMRFGRTRLAFPATLYVDALLDAPSAMLRWNGISIVDDHRFGDPVVSEGHVRTAVAACPAGMLRKGTVLADFPYILSIEAPLDDGPVRLVLTDMTGTRHATILISISPRDRRVTELLWSAHGPLAADFSPAAVIDTDRLARAGDFVSGSRYAANGQPLASEAMLQE